MIGRRTGCIPVPYPDENCYSILCRYGVRCGFRNTFQLCRELFGNTEPLSGYVFKPFRLPNLQRWYNQTEIPYGLKFGANHSCFQFYTMFLQIEEAGLLRQSIVGSDMTPTQRKSISQKCGFPRGHKRNLWYCPECVKEDFRKYRETYWRRLPQMPGASYCKIHQVRFRESGVSFRDIEYKLFPATYALNHIPEPESKDGNIYEEEFLRLAEDIDWLLKKGFSFSDSEWIQRSFTESTGKQLYASLPIVNPDGKNGNKRFDDYLVGRLYREIGTIRLPETIWRQVGTILSIEKAFGTVEQFFQS